LPSVENAADTNGDGIISNIEYYEATNPLRNDQVYIYDHFNWDHCEYDKSNVEAYMLQTFMDMSTPDESSSQDEGAFRLIHGGWIN